MTIEKSIIKKQLVILTILGLIIMSLFIAGFLWLVYYIRANGDAGGEKFLEYAPYWVFPYLIVMSLYVGFLSTRIAKGKWKYTWLWGIIGFTQTLFLILIIPSIISPIFPDQRFVVFAGPALSVFLAPIISAVLILLLIKTLKRKTERNLQHLAG